MKRNPGSFRDPSGSVYDGDGRIFRTVSEAGRSSYEAIREARIVRELQDEGRIVGSSEVPQAHLPYDIGPGQAYVLEHPRIPYISYPYEWSFERLKCAALHHLDIQIDLLKAGFVLSDATAYNIQFVGSRPVFIDHLSIRPYRAGEYWSGHRQFCEQFLNPLLLRAILGVPHNAWFRGALEGISTVALARLIPTSYMFSWNVFTQVSLQAKLERRAIASPDQAVQRVKKQRSFPRTSYAGVLQQMRRWIAKLIPADAGKTTWSDYATYNTYSNEEAGAKGDFIKRFAADTKPTCLFDLGCNTGNFSNAALDGGAGYVVGFDFDQKAVDLGFLRSQQENSQFLSLWLDAANPSPSQGWRQSERQGFFERADPDALIALAFEHHLAIGKNVPLPYVVEWLVSLAPQGIIEFVPKEDPTIRKMLAIRDDIFPQYDAETFEEAIRRFARIDVSQPVSASGRTLYRYSRL